MRPVWANQGANGREHERTELAWLPVKTPNNAPHRWIIVADSPFIPARGGGEREHLGFVELAVEAGLVSALVVPTDDDPEAVGREDDLDALRALVFPAPLITVPRARSHLRALISPLPYVVASRPAPSDLVERVGVAAPDADAVVVFTYKSHEIGRVLAEGLNLPAVLRQHNLEGPYHHALAAAAKPPTSWLVGAEARRIDADERRLEHSAWLRGIADISSSDAELRRRRSRVPVVHVPPFALGNATAAPPEPWTPTGSLTAVFLGALDVSTNHDAIRFFAEQVWPLVRKAVPQARWSVVGRRPTDAVRALLVATPGAELHADVADPRTYLRQAAVAVNPAVSGSGVNIKLVEYLATGVPVVSTERGMAGLQLTPGQDLLVADEPGAFADSVATLISRPTAAQTIGATGRSTALELMDGRAGLDKVGLLLSSPPDSEAGLEDLEVVLVSYRSRHHVEALLTSWPDDLSVVVVDNSGNVDGIAEVAAQRPGIRYLDGGAQGFARAANLGAGSSTKPYVAFVNPDSRPAADHLLALVRGLAADPSAISHAATVTDSNGGVEMGVGGWEPSVPRTAAHAVGLHKLAPRSAIFAQPRPGQQVEVDWTTGACMVVRRQPFAALGGFDETFFVYAEDMAFGRNARETGWACRLREDVVVPHGAGSSGAPSLEMLRLRGASFAGYVRRYHPGWRATAMRGLFAAGAAMRAIAQRVTGRNDAARLSIALVRGVLTQRAFVGGVEVARARFAETTGKGRT